MATNPVADNADAVIQFAITKLAAGLLIAELDAAIPALNLPILHELSSEAIYIIAEQLSKKLQLFTNFVIIDLETQGETTNYEKAEGDLRKACISGDVEKIQIASDEYDKALAKLVHYDGSSIPS